MIEINLLPGSEKRKKKSAGAGFSLKMPDSLAEFDRMTMFIIVAWIIGPVIGLWLFLGVRADRSEAQAGLDVALADSARYARIIETQDQLEARQDTIAEKLAMIQEIDAGRYIWSHVLDEVSRALPPYTWLTGVYQMSGGANPEFNIEGRTGSLPALTRYMDALEASPFIRNVQLVGSEQAQLGEGRVVNDFVLTGLYEQPPVEMIETVPLFEGMAVSEDAPAEEAEEESDGTGTP